MKILFISLLLFATASAHAEWFVRGSHNSWAATQMTKASTTNTMELNNVVFSTAGHIKFDRYGDWYESYGEGGLYGSNIAVAAGTWKITFYTDTKRWAIAAADATAQYHLRSNYNQWMEGTLLNRVGSSNVYEYCHHHNPAQSGAGNFQFKVDPNGGWGNDAVPASNYVVTTSGWVKISFNATTKKIITETTSAANCALAGPEPEIEVIALYQNDFCVKPNRSIDWIKSQEELDAFLNRSNNTVPFKVPDFSTHKILALSSGTKPTSGYKILFVDGELNKNSTLWNIWIKETTPSDDQPVAHVLTTPCLLIQIPINPDAEVNVFSNNESFLPAASIHF